MDSGGIWRGLAIKSGGGESVPSNKVKLNQKGAEKRLFLPLCLKCFTDLRSLFTLDLKVPCTLCLKKKSVLLGVKIAHIEQVAEHVTCYTLNMGVTYSER